MKFELKSEKSLDETKAGLIQNLKEEGFGVLWEFDVRQKLQEKGMAYSKAFVILEICNPEKAGAALEQNPDAAYLLPCKIALIEKEDGIYAGLLRPTLLTDLMGDEELHDIAHDVERHLKRAILESM